MAAIESYFPSQGTFDAQATFAMSRALDRACAALRIPSTMTDAREIVATRIIDLARTGVVDARVLRDRVLFEALAAE